VTSDAQGSHADKGKWDGAYLKDEFAVHFRYNNIYQPTKTGMVSLSSVRPVFITVSPKDYFSHCFPD